MILNINTDAVVAFSAKLDRLHRSALPSAVRGALNDAAFDVKTNTMPTKSDSTFEKRQPNFFKANSRFEKANGFNVNSMKATVGFVEGGLRGGNNFAVKDLEQQESGGEINKKSFIPMTPARTGSNPKKIVRANARLKQIKIINSRNSNSANPKQAFIKSVAFAGKGGNVLSEFNGKQILWRVDSTNRNVDGGFKLTPIYSFKKGRSVSVKSTGFMKAATQQSASKIEQFYIKQAERQIEKFK